MCRQPPKPFFIVGHPRSGTTLLRFVLSSHPHLHVPAETGFIPFLQISPDRPLTLQDVEEAVGRIEKLNVHWRGLVSDLPAFYESLPSPVSGYLLDSLYRRQLKRRNIPDSRSLRWGDKSPGYVNYVAKVAAIFPEAQFIHMIRDGRDAMLSALKKWPRRQWYMDEYYLLKRWVESVRAGKSAGATLGPQRYLEVHYEALVAEPETEIRRICTFLREPFTPILLDHTQLAQKIGVGAHKGVEKPITTASVARWRRELSPFSKKLANRLAGSTLVAAGYPLAENSPLDLVEEGRLLGMALKFHVIDSIRRLLYRQGVLTLNRGKRR